MKKLFKIILLIGMCFLFSCSLVDNRLITFFSKGEPDPIPNPNGSHVCFNPEEISIKIYAENTVEIPLKYFETDQDGNKVYNSTILFDETVSVTDSLIITFKSGLPENYSYNNETYDISILQNSIKVNQINDIMLEPLELVCKEDNIKFYIGALNKVDWINSKENLNNNSYAYYSGFYWYEEKPEVYFTDSEYEEDINVNNKVSCRLENGYYIFTVPVKNKNRIYPRVDVEYEYSGKTATRVNEVAVDLYSIEFSMSKAFLRIAFNKTNRIYFNIYLLNENNEKLNVKEFPVCTISLLNNMK